MKMKSNRSKKDKILRIIATVMGIVGIIVIAVVCIHQVWVRPPQVVDPAQPTPENPEVTAPAKEIEETPLPSPMETGKPEEKDENDEQREQLKSNRKEGVYTILLVGNDDGQGNTDTILVGKIDTVNHQMDFVTIPRDTLINMPWPVRKIPLALGEAEGKNADFDIVGLYQFLGTGYTGGTSGDNVVDNEEVLALNRYAIDEFEDFLYVLIALPTAQIGLTAFEADTFDNLVEER